MQFEILMSVLSAADSNGISTPKFPILVRCDGVEDQLSDITIRIGGGRQLRQVGDVSGGGGISLDMDDSLVLLKSYRLFHRKL